VFFFATVRIMNSLVGRSRRVQFLHIRVYRSWPSAVGIATALRAGRLRGRSSNPGRIKNFLFCTSAKPALVPTQPSIQVPAALSPGVKRPGREADHSSPTSAEGKKMWVYTSTPSYALMA
jgi:hypothetical protein